MRSRKQAANQQPPPTCALNFQPINCQSRPHDLNWSIEAQPRIGFNRAASRYSQAPIVAARRAKTLVQSSLCSYTAAPGVRLEAHQLKNTQDVVVFASLSYGYEACSRPIDTFDFHNGGPTQRASGVEHAQSPGHQLHGMESPPDLVLVSVRPASHRRHNWHGCY